MDGYEGVGAIGQVDALFVGPQEGQSVSRVGSIDVVAGRGIVGDRYYDPDGAGDALLHITLFPREGFEAARAESELDLDPADLRRNVMTIGIDYRTAVGEALRIGDVLIDSIIDNPPCAQLQRLAGKPLLQPLVGRAGVRGRIVEGGRIRQGDPVVLVATGGRVDD